MYNNRNRLWSYVYHGKTICQSNVMKCVGDIYEDYIVWAVDYRNRVIHLTKVG